MGDSYNFEITNEQLRHVLLKNPENRSYDDLLVLKGFILKTEFMLKSLAGIVNPKQMNDLCRGLGMETYSDGDVVFNQGDIGDKVFILMEGSVDLRVRYKIDLTQGESEIREKFIKTYTERGSYFGERALQFDEPRSGTVIASSITSLITVSKNSFVAVIKEAKLETQMDGSNLTSEQMGSKENVIRVLSKMRTKRTNQELDAVAAYLYRRIPFFQRFTMPQLVELCRVAETVSVWGRSILFKQGSIGQAFYVVLTGTVEVWVNNSDNQTPSSTNRIQHKFHDVTDGLGIKVNQLVSGEIFGERALENEDSMRMASIVTCEGNTELIVISREDYHNLVYVMMHVDSMKRLSLLRRTELFRTTDVQHLKSMSRFMEPRTFQLNEKLYTAGTRAIEIIIIESGECRVETEIREGIDLKEKEDHDRKTMHYLAPTAVIDGTYHEEDHMNAPFRVDPMHAKHGHNNPAGTGTEPHITFSDGLDGGSSLSSSATVTMTGSDKAGASVAPKKKKFTLPKIHGTIQEEEDDNKEKESSVAQKIRMKKLHSMHLMALKKAHTVNLGRIAPNSVLATYITQGSLAEDVYHPETVIASSLVTAYTIGKHDFFNHLPKDTRFALEKIIADYKPPELTSLWQNNPKIIDEDTWKKEKAWKMFKHDLAAGKHNIKILDEFKKLEAVHLTANSGNDRYMNINMKTQQSREVRNASGVSIHIDSNWGLKNPEKDENADTQQQQASSASSKGTMPRKSSSSRNLHKHASSHHQQHHEAEEGHEPGDPLHRRPSQAHHLTVNEKLHQDIEAEEAAHPLHSHYQPGEHLSTVEIMGQLANPNASLISSAVSHMIRNRLSHAHFGEKIKKELFSIHTEQPSLLTQEPHLQEASASVIDETAHLLGGAPDNGSHAFYLVQLHREATKNTGGGLLDGSKRMVRCYLRLCGAVENSIKAKNLADAMMENIYLTLFRSDPLREKELLLNWTAFKGFDSISVSDTDHFLIYCRGAPIQYASIKPSKNIFNCPYPALCKQQGQRYACVVVNRLNPQNQNNEKNSKGHHHHHRHHHRHHHHHNHSHHHHHGKGGGQGQGQEDTDSDEDKPLPAQQSPPQKGAAAGRNPKSSNSAAASRSRNASEADATQAPVNNNANATTSTTSAASAIGSAAPIVSSPSTRSKGNTSAAEVDFDSGVTGTTGAAAGAEGVDAVGNVKPAEYLMEFSALNEVILVSSTRMDCLKYAIGRFGTTVDPETAAGGLSHLTAKESEARAGANGKLYVKPVAAGKPDRILTLLHAGKRLCVVPLFNWILVNDETAKSLDFTNGFNDSAQKLVFVEEELEHSRLTAIAFSKNNKSAVVGASSSVTNDRVNVDDVLFKSFSEVGLLHNDHAINDDNDHYIPKVENLEEHQSIQTKSLGMLERDFSSHELAKNVHLQQDQLSAAASSQSAKMRRKQPQGTWVDRNRSELYNERALAAMETQQSNKKQEPIPLEVKLKSLNENAAQYVKLSDQHDNMCYSEHVAQVTAASTGAFPGKLKPAAHVHFQQKQQQQQQQGSGRGSSGTVAGNGTGAGAGSQPPESAGSDRANKGTIILGKHVPVSKTKELIADRMRMIENLQKLQFQKVTLDKVVADYNSYMAKEQDGRIAQQNSGGGSAPGSSTGERADKKARERTGKSNMPGSAYSVSGQLANSTVSVGKRLSESLGVLNESLNSRIK